MIDRKKFDDLSDDEKLILGESIGLPDYPDNDALFDSLNEFWSIYCDVYNEKGERCEKGNPNTFIDIVKKL